MAYYIGEGEGFRGTIKIEVEIKNGLIGQRI